jgi:hypothetical protein
MAPIRGKQIHCAIFPAKIAIDLHVTKPKSTVAPLGALTARDQITSRQLKNRVSRTNLS